MAVKPFRGLLRRQPEEPIPEAEPERCLSCQADLRESRLYAQYKVCHACGFHYHLTARERIALLADPGTFEPHDDDVSALDPLDFALRRPYRSRIIEAQRRTGLTEAALTGTAAMFGREVVLGAIDYGFLGGSIGVAAGERLARAFERAARRRAPLIIVYSSAGTRMQEGLLALMQVPRVAAAARALARARVPHVAVLTDPTTGLAYVGLANVADYLIAEPNAVLGYAALRVVEEAQREGLPEGAHSSASHAAAGLVDAVIARPDLRDALGLVLDVMMNSYRLSPSREARIREGGHTYRAAWEQVQLSRHEGRPTAAEFALGVVSPFVELRGDRCGTDDDSVVAGIGSLAGQSVVVIAHNRRSRTGQAWVRAAGLRKARRAIALASRFDLPLLAFIDTPGFEPTLENEEAGLGAAATAVVRDLLDVNVPTLAVITGEGGSEAAMTFAIADRVLMLDNAVFEVIRPEDAAGILAGRPAGAQETRDVAERLRLTSHDCLRLRVIDATVPEPADGAHANRDEAIRLLRRALIRHLVDVQRQRPGRRLKQRWRRYRELGPVHTSVRGKLERRLAHLGERVTELRSRLRRRGPRYRNDDVPGIPL
ncbi:MAG: carboxyl transferase domain-containing protein [Chloroflexota bacterium]|nr:acetyl-CoA carboxylase carboxyl transferase subunit beta [Dehalococcoidia bacterium]MDW8045736.1 carboxyl transferase domain-containing protein [Chloroflexota bacterium]